jgi:DNA polymerase I-like protein with 3'-5' exonuclease and polymerase domains
MKQAVVILHKKLRKSKIDFKFVVNCHDEWQIETTPEAAELVGKLGVDSIREAGEHFNMRCPLTGEYKIGESWRDTH